jgi:hypothetical protein
MLVVRLLKAARPTEDDLATIVEEISCKPLLKGLVVLVDQKWMLLLITLAVWYVL